MKSAKKFDFKFTIVSAVYNVAEFLPEMIDSIISQDIGFKENVQLILVDDCSTDNSFAICKAYQSKFPNNIVVKQTKINSRQAHARNIGLRYASGKYINFCDPDDVLSKNTLSLVWDFFEKHFSETNIVSIPLFFFGDLNGPHMLNDKFDGGSRIIDLNKEPEYIQLSAASAFFKNTKNLTLSFDTSLYHAEDAKMILQLLDTLPTLGVVSEAKYYYRKRASGTVSTRQFNKNSYLAYVDNFLLHIINFYKNKYKTVPKFVQSALMYDIQSKFSQSKIPDSLMNQQELKEYVSKLFWVTENINENIIWRQKYISREIKLLIDDYKENKLFSKQKYIEHKKNKFVSHKLTNRIIVDNIDIDNENYKMTFCFHLNLSPFVSDFQLFLHSGKKQKTMTYVKTTDNFILNNVCIFKSHFYKFDVDLHDCNLQKFHFVLKAFNEKITITDIIFSKNTPISSKLHKSFYIFDKFKLKKINNVIVIKRKKHLDRLGSEVKFDFSIMKQKTYLKKWKIILARWLYLFLYPFLHNKNIWLISDKADRADDNGEAFFKYCQKNKTNQKLYFLISKKYPDYKRMKQYGRVVDFMSIKHIVLFMFAKYNISAHSHSECKNPFGVYEEYFRDITFNVKFVFLQHGIIFGDISRLLKRNILNAKYFVSSTNAEHESLLQENYGYEKENIILTGLPRFDYLYSNTKKIITFAPTWRRSLFSYMDSKTSKWILAKPLEESEYYKSICSLLSNKKLLDFADTHGYQIQFLPHSTLFPYADKFKIDKRVKVLTYENVCFRDVFAESSLIITDYSSLVFDFAYLRKPVLYYHSDNLSGSNYDSGYFDFERDGFGEICYTENDLVKVICDYIEFSCKIKTKYLKRINNTFAFNDKNCCQRIFDILTKK